MAAALTVKTLFVITVLVAFWIANSVTRKSIYGRCIHSRQPRLSFYFWALLRQPTATRASLFWSLLQQQIVWQANLFLIATLTTNSPARIFIPVAAWAGKNSAFSYISGRCLTTQQPRLWLYFWSLLSQWTPPLASLSLAAASTDNDPASKSISGRCLSKRQPRQRIYFLSPLEEWTAPPAN